jgi:hypothetical protein
VVLTTLDGLFTLQCMDWQAAEATLGPARKGRAVN